jgi:hypothetical protein
MTDTVIGQGRGRVGLRFQIAGMPFEAVTDEAMAGSGAGFATRAAGLKREGIVLAHDVDFARAELNASPITIRIADTTATLGPTRTPWTKLFSKTATGRTWLDATCDDVTATITVRSTSGFAASGRIWIDQECIEYTGITATTFTGCSRGSQFTVPTFHYSLDTTGTHAAEVTDWPQSMEGRHCWLYTYGQLDDPSGDGTQRWAGIISRDARQVDGTTWELSVDPITRVFQGPFGGDLALPMRPRGIYYPWSCCFFLEIYVSTDNTAANLPSAPTATIQITGFYETQDAFCSAVQGAIDGSSASGRGLTCVSDGPSGFHFELTTASATQRFVAIYATSPLDEVHGNYSAPGAPTLLLPLLDSGKSPVGTTIGASASVSASTTYYYVHGTALPGRGPRIASGTYFEVTHTDAVSAPGSVPRGAFLHSTGTGDNPMVLPEGWRTRCSKPSAASAAPTYRVYLDGFNPLTGLDSFSIDYGHDGPTVTSGLITHDDATRRIDLQGPGIPMYQSVCFAGLPCPVLHPVRYYGVGTLHDLRLALISAVSTGAPSATAPYLYDVSLSNATLLTSDFGGWGAADITGFRVARRYWSSGKAQKLGEVLTEEAKNAGCFWSLDANGRIELYQVGIAPTTGSWTLDATKELTDRGPSAWERSAKGSVAQVVVSTDYDPLKDEWPGDPIPFQFAAAMGRNPSAQPIEIKPRSRLYDPGGLLTFAQVLTEYAMITGGLFSLFGYAYSVITLDAPFTFLTAICGDTVVITSKNLPSGTGGRGMSQRNGVIIGKRVSFEDSAIKLTILCSELNYSGYTPTSRISSSANTGGFNYTLTIAAPAGTGATRAYSDGTAFKNGDAIRIVLWDSTTSSTQTGFVTADGTATTVLVNLDGAIPGGSPLNLEYAPSSRGWATNQGKYCPVAPATDIIDYGGADLQDGPAKQLI